MSDQSTGDTERLNHAGWHVDAVCPYCNRMERFDEELAFYAWVVGHFQEEHPDKLPEFSNTGTDRSRGDAE